jgi:hypothetical protein
VIEPFFIRSRLFRALGVPSPLCPLLHAWALVEGRKFCHEFMGDLLCLRGSEKAIRIAVGRKLDSLALFSKTFGYNLGSIERGGGQGKQITYYGSFPPNRAVAWIHEQLGTDADISNPIVAIDRYVGEAIARHIPQIQREEAEKKRKQTTNRRESTVPRQELSLRSVALLNLPNCTFESALIMARLGFPVFPAWGVFDGVCFCPRGSECKNPGKHPCVSGWQQLATTYEPTLVKLWEKFPSANVGIATGRRWLNGELLTVIDCDHRSFGHGSISHLERNELCPLPVTREHSRGGGPHRFFTHPRGFHSKAGALGQGIDVQSFGKLVIAPGSTHKSGQIYEVTVDLPIARLPELWADRIDAISSKSLPLIQEGQRRAWLLKCAGGMVGQRMTQDLALEVLKDRRDKRCEKGTHSFSDDDLRGMIVYCQQQERLKAVRRVA